MAHSVYSHHYTFVNVLCVLRPLLHIQVEERLRFYEEGVKTRPNAAVMEEAAGILAEQIGAEGGDIVMGGAENGVDVKEKKKKKKKSKKAKEEEEQEEAGELSYKSLISDIWILSVQMCFEA